MIWWCYARGSSICIHVHKRTRARAVLRVCRVCLNARVFGSSSSCTCTCTSTCTRAFDSSACTGMCVHGLQECWASGMRAGGRECKAEPAQEPLGVRAGACITVARPSESESCRAVSLRPACFGFSYNVPSPPHLPPSPPYPPSPTSLLAAKIPGG